MPGRRWLTPLLAVTLIPGGCSLVGLVARTPQPDEPAPYTLRAALEPAREALLDGWPRTEPVRFRFVEGRCGIGAMAVLVFEQLVPSEPPTMALALSEDVAKGILLRSWVTRYDVPDPDADAGLQRLIGGREIPCP